MSGRIRELGIAVTVVGALGTLAALAGGVWTVLERLTLVAGSHALWVGPSPWVGVAQSLFALVAAVLGGVGVLVSTRRPSAAVPLFLAGSAAAFASYDFFISFPLLLVAAILALAGSRDRQESSAALDDPFWDGEA